MQYIEKFKVAEKGFYEAVSKKQIEHVTFQLEALFESI